MTLDEGQGDDVSAAVDERMERLRELARLRRESRKAVRERMAARRTAGLAVRHQNRLERIGGTDQ